MTRRGFARRIGCCWAGSRRRQEIETGHGVSERIRQESWPQYAQVLLSSNEFSFVN